MSSWGDEGRSIEELRAERIARRAVNRLYKRLSRQREKQRAQIAAWRWLASLMINRKRGT